MSELRPFALLSTGDQWVRSSFTKTFLNVLDGIVELAWTTSSPASKLPAPTVGAGLAFDQECRLYHSLPAEGRVERLIGVIPDPSRLGGDPPESVDLFPLEPDLACGDFTSPTPAQALREPRGLAVDINDRLFIAETAADCIAVIDLWDGRMLQKITLPGGSRPTDLAAWGDEVYAVLAGVGKIIRCSARSAPSPFELPKGCTRPSRIALSPAGRIAILENAGEASAHIWFADTGFKDFPAPAATDLEWESETVLVVAQRPGLDFLRYQIGPDQRVALPPLRARAYKGLGIVALPAAATASRRIGFWTDKGFRTALPARLVYGRTGRVTTFRLDSGAYQTVWGRLFIDACIPEGTDVRVHYIVLDEADEETLLPRVPPPNIEFVAIKRPDLSPPMPPAALLPTADNLLAQRLHRRESGREMPWTQPAPGDNFITYEAPINAPAGRYLWITLELSGNTQVSPKIKCLRAEYPSHDYLRRLPKTFSRDPLAASFLQRYLAMFEGFLGEVEARAVERDLLFEARSTPAEALPWLASFLGLVLDERWADAPGQPPVDVRRTFVAEIAWLFRYRGTLPGLARFIEIYVGRAVVIIEHYRLRGVGVAVLGDSGAAFSSSVLGGGFRVGGAVGSDIAQALNGSPDDAYRSHAHRFTVIIPARLTAEQLEVVNHIIEIHRPAHTVFDLCVVDAGMRVGRGLLVGVTSLVGQTGGFKTLQLGASTLGRGAIIGRPSLGGILPGDSRLGQDTQVG